MPDPEVGKVREVRQQGVVGIVSMYLLWHDERRPPVVLVSFDEVKVYIQLMRTVRNKTPRWCKLDAESGECI